MAYRIPTWGYGVFGGAMAIGAIVDKPRRSTWVLSAGLGFMGLIVWNVYVEARTIEAVVSQGYIYGAPPGTSQDEQPMSGYRGLLPP